MVCTDITLKKEEEEEASIGPSDLRPLLSERVTFLVYQRFA